jgi:prevent-host-death family protein
MKELKTRPGRIISMVNDGNEITVTLRGKPAAKIVPVERSAAAAPDDAFGIWKDRRDMDDVDAFLDSMRKDREL